MKDYLLHIICERGGLQHISTAENVDKAINQVKSKEFFFDSDRKRSLGKVRKVNYIREI